MTVNAIYRELTNTFVVITYNGELLFKGMENEIPVELMDDEVAIMRVSDNQLVITVR